MKRSNKIFLAGLLCFCLGYITHDIVGEAGVKLAGTATAFPLYTGIPQDLASAREISKDHQALLIKHKVSSLCKNITSVRLTLIHIYGGYEAIGKTHLRMAQSVLHANHTVRQIRKQVRC